MTDYWFRPERYGYGATPVTWQRWAFTLGIVAAMVAMVAVSLTLRLTEPHDWALVILVAFDALALATLFVVARRKTAGGFRWCWGDR